MTAAIKVPQVSHQVCNPIIQIGSTIAEYDVVPEGAKVLYI